MRKCSRCCTPSRLMLGKTMHKTKEIELTRITQRGMREVWSTVVRELPLTVFFNGKELVTTLCSPVDLNYLAVGILASEGLLKSKDEIKELNVEVFDCEEGFAIEQQIFQDMNWAGIQDIIKYVLLLLYSN